MLTEQEVARSWRQIFTNGIEADAFDRAEQLLDELRPESPLRHRLMLELEELRKKQAPAPAPRPRAARQKVQKVKG